MNYVVILLDLDPVRYSKAVCRILIFWLIIIISDHFLFLYFFLMFNQSYILIFAFILNAFFLYLTHSVNHKLSPGDIASLMLVSWYVWYL